MPEMGKSAGSGTWRAVAVLAAVVMLRIVYILVVRAGMSLEDFRAWTYLPDSGGYVLLADDLSDLRMDYPSYRLPGYPLLIAMMTLFFGDGRFLGVVVFQQITDGLIAALMFLLARRYVGRWAPVPALVFLVHPYSLAFSARILPSALAGLFVILPTLLLLRRPILGWRMAAACGLILSVGVMVRPMLVYSALPLAVFALVRDRRYFRKILFPLVVLLAGSAVFPSFMRIRNREAFGLDSMSLQGNFEIAGRIAVLTGHVRQERVFADGGFRDSLESLATVDGMMDYDSRDSIYMHAAVELFRRNPWPVIGAHLLGWTGFFQLGNPHLDYMRMGDEDVSSPLNRLIQVFILLSSILMFAGTAISLAQRRDAELSCLGWLSLVWFAYAGAVHGPICGPGYALPFMPVWLVSGSAGWLWYLRNRRILDTARRMKTGAIQ